MVTDSESRREVDEFGRPTQFGWNKVWRIPEGRTFAELNADPDRCTVDGCIGPRIGGSAGSRRNVQMWPLGLLVSDYCYLHAARMGQYGSPFIPAYLERRPNCSAENEDPRTGRRTRCWEPQVANGLCAKHVWKSDTKFRYEDVLIAVAAALGEQPEPGVTDVVTDDTRRVLAEIDRISREGSTAPRRPLTSMDAFIAMGAGMFLMFAPPQLDEVSQRALEMSPFELHRALNIPPDEVAQHLRILAANGDIVVRPKYELPDGSLLVVAEHSYTKSERRYVQRQRLRNLFPSRYMKVTYGKPPQVGTKVYEVIFEGAGIIHPAFQGRVWELTNAGKVELQAWRTSEERRRQQERQEVASRRISVAALMIAFASLVSVVADAPSAVKNVGAFISWLLNR